VSRAAGARRWAWVVAGLGLVLLGLLFADWYDFDAAPRTVYEIPDPGLSGSEYTVSYFATGDLDGWGTGGVTRIVVVLLSILCMARALLLGGAADGDGDGDAGGTRRLVRRLVLPAAALITVACLAARIAWPPDEVLVATWGLWASLAVAAVILLVSGAQALAGRPRAADG